MDVRREPKKGTSVMIHTETGRVRWRVALASSVILSLGSPASEVALSQPVSPSSREQPRTYHIGAQALGTALQEFATQAGLQLLFSQSDVAGLKTSGLQGSFSTDQALERLLAGSGLIFEYPKPDAVIIRRAGNAPEAAASGGKSPASPGTSNATPDHARTSSIATTNSSLTPAGNGTQSASDIDEVVITTGRAGLEQRTKLDTSYSVTNIDQERLRLQGPTSVTESLKSVPGFWVEASGGEASGNVRARGIPVDGFGSITLLEDGMPVQNDPALGYLNADQAFRLDETIDRIEVVRGGPSSVFYSNAPAGAVNFIPRAVGDHAEGVAKYTAGDYGLNRIDAWYGAPIGDWKVSAGGFYRYDNGIRDPGFHGDNGGQFRATLGRDFEGGRVSFDFKRLDDTVYLDLGIPMRVNSDGKIRAVPGFNSNFGTLAGPETSSVQMQTVNATGFPATGAGAGPLVPGTPFSFDNTLGTQVKRTQLTTSLEFDLGDGFHLSDRIRYDETNTLRNGVYPNTVASASTFLSQQAKPLASFYPTGTSLQLIYTDTGTPFNTPNGLVIVGGLRSVTSPVKELMNDTRLMREFEVGSQTHDATLGFYVANVTQNFNRYSSTALLNVQENARLLDIVAVDASGKVVSTLTDHGIYHYGYEWANANGQATNTAFYLADEWQITRALRLDAGARWEQVHMTANTEESETVKLGTSATSAMLTGNGQFVHFNQTFSKVGWTVGGNWQFTDHSGLFARFTPAFRLPSLSTYTTAGLTASNNTVAKPITQTMDFGEIGFKFATEWTELYTTAFWTKYNNAGFTNYVFNINSPTPQPQNLYADTRTYGLELEGGFYPVSWFDLTFSSTLERPEYDGLRYTDNAGVLHDYDGNQLIRVPKISARIVPGFNLFDQRLRLQVSWEWEGARYVDTANSVVLPHYDVLNFSGRLAVTGRFNLYGYIDNVTNSMGLTEGNPRVGEVQNADAGASTFIARPILGRAYRLSMMYRF
jgi:outer membrane receptor protein involved in Fe transport